jgi:hypothetical protein
MNNDRNMSGTFNNELGLGGAFTQNQAGVNSWDTPFSAQTKVLAHNQKYSRQAPVENKKSTLYGLAYKLGQMFK